MLYIAFVIFVISVDSLFSGLTIGVKKIKFPLTSALVIFFVSFLMFLVSSFLGHRIISLFPPDTYKFIASAVFSAVGFFMIFEGLMDVREKDRVNIHLKPLKLIITIIREGTESDVDGSKTIDSSEAIYLGTALSIDAAAAGTVLITDGISIFAFATLSSVITTLLLLIGVFLGKKLSFLEFSHTSILSGIMLLIIGLLKLF